MKLDCRVTKVSNSGDTITIGLSGKQPHDAFWRPDGDHTIEVACTDKARRAFWLGRKVVVTIEPR
jgi:hypothetical protein